MALKVAGPGAVGDVMRHLIGDVNLRIRLIAASCLLPADPGNVEAGAVLMEALGHPALRIRKAALELVESLGAGGVAFLGGLKKRDGLEEEPELRDALARLIERLAPPAHVVLLEARNPVADDGFDFPSVFRATDDLKRVPSARTKTMTKT